MPAYTDEQLVLEVLDSSPQAFEQLVKQYQYSVIRTIASIISDEQAVQDVAQETFLTVWTDLAKLKEKRKFGRWLNQIAINLSKLWLRDQRKHRENRASLDENVVVLTQELRYQRDRLRQEIWEAIDELTADYREAVVLHYISGYSYKEISDMLSVPISTVRGRLQEARNQLRKEFLDMVTQLQLEIDSTVHKFLKEHAKQNGVSIESLIIRLIERYKRDIDKPEVTVRQVWEPSRNPTSDSGGAPSPDGRYLSFTHWSYGNLAVRDLTTGEYRDLTDEGTWDGHDQWAGGSIWSPDGKQIAYAWYNVDQWELRIVGLDGSQPRVLYYDEEMKLEHPNGIRPFTWSQDGKYILTRFYRHPGPNEPVWEIVLVSTADGSVRVLESLKSLARDDWMSLSPDGRYVVYARPVEEHDGARDIFLLATDGSGEEVPLEEHPADDYGPVWAPDGKTVVFVSDRSGTYDAWLMQVVDRKPVGEPQLVKRDTGPMHPMGFTLEGSLYYGLGYHSIDVYTASIDPATGELLKSPTKAIRRFEGYNGSPAWSPDGKSLAYVSLRPLPGSTRRRPVLVIRSLKTGEERELHEGDGRHLQWSPDGRSLLYGHNTLNRIDVQTGEVTPIVEYDPDVHLINATAWSPDGRSIFYARTLQEPAYPRSIVVHDLATGKEKELLSQGVSSSGFALSPDGQQLALGGKVLKVMPVDGGEARELLRLQDNERFSGASDGLSSFAWTADGRYVLFEKGTVPPELWRIPAEGGEPQKLLAMEGLRRISVHPDGQRIAFNRRIWTDQVWAMENFLPGFTASR